MLYGGKLPMDSDRKNAWFQLHSQVARPLEALSSCSHPWVAAHLDFEPNQMEGGNISNLHGFRLFRFRRFPSRFANSDPTKGTTACDARGCAPILGAFGPCRAQQANPACFARLLHNHSSRCSTNTAPKLLKDPVMLEAVPIPAQRLRDPTLPTP